MVGVLLAAAPPPTFESEVVAQPDGSGGGLLLLIVLLVVVGRWMFGGAKAGGHAHGDARQVRAPAGWGDGSWMSAAQRRDTERHEKRHQKVADKLGVGGNWWIHDGGGSFQRNDDRHLTGVQRAAISLAGNRGSWWNGSPCDKQDEANAKHYIDNAYPRRERSARMREAYALSRKLL